MHVLIIKSKNNILQFFLYARYKLDIIRFSILLKKF